MKRVCVWVLAASLTAPLLPGCASKYGEERTVVNYYPACYRPIRDLRESEHNVAKSTAGGAMLGAIGGALIGLLASGGKWEGAVVGGAGGAVAGTVAGNIYGTRQQEADDNRRLASYLQDIDGDISNLDVVSAAARNSLQCYDRQFSVLLNDIRSKSITREGAQARYAEIASGREEAISILGEAASQARNLDQQYEQALAYEQRQLQTPAKVAQGPAVVKQKAAAINTVRNRKTVLKKAATDMEAQKAQAQSVTANQNAEIQAILRESGSNLNEARV